MRTSRSIKEWTHEPTVHYRNPIKHECGCGRPARYYVYTNKQPHCHSCFEEAIDVPEMVPVRVIENL